MSERRLVTEASYQVPVSGFSQAVVVPASGCFVFVSGVTARDADGRVVGEGDLVVQTRQVYENLRRILAESGGSLDDVVRIVTYLTDMTRYDEMGTVRREVWPDQTPASTTVQVSRLYDPRQLIEVEATAVVAAAAD